MHVPVIREVMLNPVTRRYEAREAMRIKASQECQLRSYVKFIIVSNKDITDRTVNRLVKQYKRYAITKEDIENVIQELSDPSGMDTVDCTQAEVCNPKAEDPLVLFVGIDFGASFIKVAIADEDGVIEVAKDDDGMICFPATVIYCNDGSVLVGEALEDIDDDVMGRSCCFIRNCLPRTNEIDGSDIKKETIGYILRTSVRFAEEYWHEQHPNLCRPTVSNITVCYPYWFSVAEREIFTEACKESGENIVETLDDLSAIAATYGITSGNEGKSFLVFDLGYTTLFVGNLSIKQGGIVVERYEHSDIGGRLWTESVIHYFLDQLGLSSDDIDIEILNYLRKETDRAKEELSHSHATEVLVQLPKLTENLRLTREQFESILSPYMERAIQIVQRVIGDSSIHQILLAGGESNMPGIREALECVFGIEVRKYKPESAVSIGALLHNRKSNMKRGDS